MLPALALLALTAGAPRAQSTHDHWRTLDTGHFRVHYPVEAEDWVLQAASRFEAIHAEVVQVVGHEPVRKVDVVVMDPYAQANGFAMPMLGTPRMGVFPSPPGADSVLAHYHDWADDLVTHEDVHLVHMDRGSRNPVGWLFTRGWLGIGPLAIKSPMWAIEGYATMLEGQLTGAGRPHGPARAAYLRSLALEGQLPDYAALNGSDAWRGRAAPYLVGSAFFEWLVEAHGEQSARDLWARLSARKIRFFDAAFEGVYGATPQELYARFCAELTHRAMTIEEARPPQQGTLWHELTRSTGAPAVSPEGARIAVVQDHEDLGRRILVLDIADNTEAREGWQEGVDKVQAKDPEDVAPVEPEVFPHEELERFAQGGRRPVGPRWITGDEILFTSWVRQPQGDLLPELFIWDIDRGHARRLTHGAGVQDADPHGGGSFAVAVQQRWGEARLVRVDLHTGAITELTPMELDVVHDQPRVRPGGLHVGWLRHRGAWEVVLRNLNSEAERTVPLPAGSEPLHLAWDDADHLVLSLALDGFVELVRVPIDGGTPTRLTQTTTAALAPEPTTEGVFYLVPDSQGYDLHWLPRDAALPPQDLAPGEARNPAVPLSWTAEPVELPPTPFEEEPRDYGLGRAEWRPMVGANSWRGGGSATLGLRAGDVVGRWEALAQGTLPSGDDLRGGALRAAWRGWPVELQLHGFGATDGDEPRGGAELSAGLLRFGDARWGRARAGLWADAGWGDDATPARRAGFAHLAGGQRLWLGNAWIDGAAQLDGQQGSSAGAAWQLGSAEAQLGLGFGPLGLQGSYRRDVSSGGGDLGRMSLGGDHVDWLPDPWQQHRIAFPALVSDSAFGSDHDVWRASLDVERSLDLFMERHRIWDRSDDAAPAGATLVGLELRSGAPSNPMARLPGMDLSLGAGFVLEHPDDGWLSKPYLDKDNWALWTGLHWEL